MHKLCLCFMEWAQLQIECIDFYLALPRQGKEGIQTVRQIKRSLFGVITICVGVFLSGCGASDAPQRDEPAVTASVQEIAAAVVNSQENLPKMTMLTWGEEELSLYLEGYYGLGEALVEDGVICYADGVEASEIAILRLQDTSDVGAVGENLSDYITGRAQSFVGYVPEQATLAYKGQVIANGNYIAMLICDDTDAAKTAFSHCFDADWTAPDVQAVFSALTESDMQQETPLQEEMMEEGDTSTEATQQSEPSEEERSTQSDEMTEESDSSAAVSILQQADRYDTPAAESSTVTDDPYDAEAVLSAYWSGDTSLLSPKNLAIYNAAVNVIATVVNDGMTEYEKELALHDWIAANCEYDAAVHDHSPSARPNPDNDNPYGMLIGGVGICKGYSGTFQLFMDMVGVECITVPGASGIEEHAWNMVRLDDEWYCVDMTWDDPYGVIPRHDYFNVTSEYMRETVHQWDESSVPEATATRYAYD